MGTNHYETTEKLLEAVFSVVHANTVARQWRGKHISAAIIQHSTIEELLEMVFSAWS
jgi:hypothetical protein